MTSRVLCSALAAIAVLFAAGHAGARPIAVCAETVPQTLDPAGAATQSIIPLGAHQVLDRLVTIADDGLTVEPRLARWWDITDDGRSVIFKLRRGVQFQERDDFSPSRPFGPEDVVFTFERLLDPEHRFHATGTVARKLAEIVNTVEAMDGDRVRFALKQPHAGFLYILAMDGASIHSAEYAEGLGNDAVAAFASRPIGTGPFAVAESTSETIELVAHAAHWEGPPAAKGLSLRTAATAQDIFVGLRDGICDIALAPDPADHEALAGGGQIDIVRLPRKAVVYVAFNTDKAPFDDRDMRRAAAAAIDKSALAPDAVPAVRITAPASAGADVDPLASGAERSNARMRLADPGADAMPLQLLTTSVDAAAGSDPVAETLSADWAEAGLATEVKVAPWAGFWDELGKGAHDAALIAFEPDTPDHALTLQQLLSCAALKAGNASNWCDPAFDAALAQATLASDPEERLQALEQAFRILDEEVPVAPLFRPLLSVAVRRGLAGIDATSLMQGDLRSLHRTGAPADAEAGAGEAGLTTTQ